MSGEQRASPTEDWRKLPKREGPARRVVGWRPDEQEWAALMSRLQPGESPGECAHRILRFVLLAQP